MMREKYFFTSLAESTIQRNRRCRQVTPLQKAERKALAHNSLTSVKTVPSANIGNLAHINNSKLGTELIPSSVSNKKQNSFHVVTNTGCPEKNQTQNECASASNV